MLALTNYFANYSVPTSLVYSQFEPRTAKCSAAYEMESFLNTVSAMKFRSDEEAAVTLDILMTGSVFKDCMIAFLVITGADAELNKRLYELSTFGINIVVYLVGVHPNVQDIMELANVRVIPVYPEDDLAKVL